MSLYNLLNGVNPATFFFLPLFDLHPDNIERFRDSSFFKTEATEPVFRILTRTGGNNRKEFPNDILTQHPNFIKTYDAENDNTYAWYEFSSPDKWKELLTMFHSQKGISPIVDYPGYLEQLVKTYPKLEDALTRAFERAQI